MFWIAWKMLIGNRVKYLGIIFGVVFAALLIAQQASIFCGLMSLTVSQIRDVEGPSIWVMDKNVQFVDDIKPLSDNELFRVKGVPTMPRSSGRRRASSWDRSPTCGSPTP